MRFCPFCANEVADEHAQCPYCGKRLPRRGRTTGPNAPAEPAPPAAATPGQNPAIAALGTAETLFAPALGAGQPSAAPPAVGSPAQRAIPASPGAPTLPPPAAFARPNPSAAPPTGSTQPPSAIAAADPDPFAPVPAAVTTAPPSAETIAAAPALVAPAFAAPAPAGSTARAEGPALPEMPTDAPPGFFGGVPYLLAVRKARSARAKTIRQLQQQNDSEQRQLEEALRDLGKLARTLGRRDPQAAGAMELLTTLETRRADAAAGQANLDEQVQAAEQDFAREAAVQNDAIGLEQVEVQRLQTDVSAQQDTLKQLKARVAQQDKLIKQLEKDQASRQAQAAKATDAPEREVATRAAAEIGVQAADLRRERDAAQSEADALLGPLAESSANLSQAKGRLQAAQQQLAAARKQLESIKRQLEGDKRAQGMEVTRLDGEIAEQLMAVGAALDADRVAEPAYEELYGRLDEHRRALDTRQQQSAYLAAERENYDQTAYRNGLLILGGGAGVVSLLILLLALLF